MRQFICIFAAAALLCAVEPSAALPESTFANEIIPESDSFDMEVKTPGIELLQAIGDTDAALDAAYDQAMEVADDSDDQREDVEDTTAAIQEDSEVETTKAKPTNTYGWWETNMVELKSGLSSSKSCITKPHLSFETPKLPKPEPIKSLQHFSSLCAPEIKVKEEKKTKESAAKENKSKRCEAAGKSATAATKKSEKLSKKLAKSFATANELKTKLADTSKESKDKMQKKTKEDAHKMEVKTGEAATKSAQESSVKKVGIESKTKKMSQMASEVTFKKKNMNHETRYKIYVGWKQHVKKEKALKAANVTATIAEEKRCKANDIKRDAEQKTREKKRKKAAEVDSKNAITEEKNIKADALKQAKEACKKGQVSEAQKSKEKKDKEAAQKVQEAAVSQERGMKEGAEKKATTHVKVKKPHKAVKHKVKAVSEESRTKRGKETIAKMKKLRAALKGANELYNKTSTTNAEKKAKCAEGVERSKKMLKAQKLKTAKANEMDSKELKHKSKKMQKEKDAKAAAAADPYNQAELISKSVLKMKNMYHSEKEKEAKTIKSTKEACDKKYKKLENEGHRKERDSKNRMNTLNMTMTRAMERGEKSQCRATLTVTEMANKAEEKFWTGKVGEMQKAVSQCAENDKASKSQAIFEVCRAAAEDLSAASSRSKEMLTTAKEVEDEEDA